MNDNNDNNKHPLAKLGIEPIDLSTVEITLDQKEISEVEYRRKIMKFNEACNIANMLGKRSMGSDDIRDHLAYGDWYSRASELYRQLFKKQEKVETQEKQEEGK